MSGSRTRLFAVAITLATGCGDDASVGMLPDAPPTDPFAMATCAIELRITGGVTTTVPPSDSATACASQIGSRSSPAIDAYYLPLDGPRVDTKIDGVMPGMTGTFAAELTIDPAGTAHRTTACMATIDEHAVVGPGELDSTKYRVRGRFTCTEAAMSASGAPATIEKFEWVTEIGWFDS